MDPDVAFGMELGGLFDAVHLDSLGEDDLKETGGVEEFQGAARSAFAEHAGEFFADALATDGCDTGGVSLDGAEGLGFDGEAEAGGEADRAQHAKPIFFKTQGRVADGADGFGGEIGSTADQIEDGGVEIAIALEAGDVEEHAVDGEVAAEDVFARVKRKADGVGPATVTIGSVVAEGGDFDSGLLALGGVFRRFVADQDDAEVGSDRESFAAEAGEEGYDLAGGGGGGDIVVVGRTAEQEIANGPSGEEGLEARMEEAAGYPAGAGVGRVGLKGSQRVLGGMFHRPHHVNWTRDWALRRGYFRVKKADWSDRFVGPKKIFGICG
jgi:hypothetical protein